MALKLPPDIVELLLDKLTADDDFRDLFARSPRGALAKLGYTPGDEEAGSLACLSVRSLASKDVIRAARDSLRAQLTATLSQTVHRLEA